MPYICVSEQSYERLTAYADTYGMSLEKAVNKAVSHWWDDVAVWSIEEAKKLCKKRRRRSAVAPLRMPFIADSIPEKIAVNL